MKMKKYASFDDYLADQPPKNRTIIRALRKFVKREAPELEESVMWGNGCWVKEKTPKAKVPKGKVPVSYVYSAPDYVQFGFIRGSALKDTKGLLEGNGQYVRYVIERDEAFGQRKLVAGRDRAASDIDQAVALDLDQAPAGAAEPRIDTEDANRAAHLPR